MTDFVIGIVGLGYVGGAIAHAHKIKDVDFYTFDIDKNKTPTHKTIEEFAKVVNFVYVAVPTPIQKMGECDTSIVESVVNELCTNGDNKTIIIKSTIPPGTTERLQRKYHKHNIFFSPEFLTEVNYINDYLQQEVMILGKSNIISNEIADIVLEKQCSVVSVKNKQVLSATAAELYKYTANTFLATKVSFANEVFDIAEKLGIDWTEIQKTLILDSRLGETHWKVPGPDGHRGYGGTCFPKDISAFIKFAESIGVYTPILNASWRRNILIDRRERDWEQLKGRAVSGE